MPDRLGPWRALHSVPLEAWVQLRGATPWRRIRGYRPLEAQKWHGPGDSWHSVFEGDGYRCVHDLVGSTCYPGLDHQARPLERKECATPWKKVSFLCWP